MRLELDHWHNANPHLTKSIRFQVGLTVELL